MSNVAVFAVGLLVTLMVAGAVSLLLWGAVMDGREDAQRRDGLDEPDAVTGVGTLAAGRPAPAGASRPVEAVSIRE